MSSDPELDLPHVSEDLGDEFAPGSGSDSDHSMGDAVEDLEPETPLESEGEDDDDVVVKPAKKRRVSPKPQAKPQAPTKQPPMKQSLPNGSESLELSLSKFSSSSSYNGQNRQPPKPSRSKPSSGSKFSKINEERYQWLLDIKDASKRPETDPEYDPRTLYIPQLAWLKFTAFERQYWEIKSKMWDTVVFFKKGKFYELYEKDAVIANTQFDLRIAGGGRANMQLAGIPEMLFEYWAKQFIDAGYKVAKVDQKESLLAKEMRDGGTKEEKIIKRELTGVLTGGTLSDLDMLSGDAAVYCMAVWQEPGDELHPQFGVAAVDVALGHLQVCQIDDDRDCTRLDTVVLQLRPKEVIVAKNNLTSLATKILRNLGRGLNQLWSAVNPITEFWDNDKARDFLSDSQWFDQMGPDDVSNYPPVLRECITDKPVAFLAFSGLLWYLNSLLLDEQVVKLGEILWYSTSVQSSYMNIDGTSLENLEVLANNDDGSNRGTLVKLVTRAQTPMGKRKMRSWLMVPLAQASNINARLDSVDFVLENGDFRSQVEKALAELPDTERLLARVKSGTLRFRDFVKVVELLEKIGEMRSLIEFVPQQTALHTALNNIPTDLAATIGEWEDAFDRRKALDDEVVPSKGVDSDFDHLQLIMDGLEQQLEAELKQIRSQFGSREVVFKDLGKEIYLIELPVRLTSQVPDDWVQMGSTSKVKRYWSPEVKKLARKLMEQRENHKLVCALLKSNLYRRFSEKSDMYRRAVDAVANVDCLLGLVRVLELMGSPLVRPEFIDSDVGSIEFKELRNPMHLLLNFIPNSVSLGGENACLGLLTGANAAGKLTLMRTTAIGVILAQLGCYVPCEQARLVPVDRIMTRLGASDNILGGHSTFYVELAETKKVLAQATNKLLVIIDELGRGGLSSDGYAIAEAVLYHLATHIQPLGYFATHFGGLVDAFSNHPQVDAVRMAIDFDDANRRITFLYKLEPGRAPGSFGMHVAAMCGIDRKIIDAAELAAREVMTEKQALSMSSSEGEQLGRMSDVLWYVSEKLKGDKMALLALMGQV